MAGKNVDNGVLASQLRVRGALTGTANLRVDGDFDGEIELDGTLVVGVGGFVRGSVRAIDLVIEGNVEGPVQLSHALIVKEGGVMKGDARAATVTVDDGAVISGMVDMVFEVDEPGSKESA